MDIGCTQPIIQRNHLAQRLRYSKMALMAFYSSIMKFHNVRLGPVGQETYLNIHKLGKYNPVKMVYFDYF